MHTGPNRQAEGPAWAAVSDSHVLCRIWEGGRARKLVDDEFCLFWCVLSPKKKVNFEILFISSGPFESMSLASVHDLLSHLFLAHAFTQSSNWNAPLCFHCIITYEKNDDGKD